MRSNKEYKRLAKEAVTPNKNKLALIFFALSVIMGIVSCIGFKVEVDPETGSTTASTYGSYISLIIGGPLSIGIASIIRKNYKKQPYEIKDVFVDGFADFTKAFLIYLLLEIFIGLWTLLFIIPGFIMALAYSMTYYIHLDHKELKAKECIKKSREIMKGHKSEYLSLIFSYFGELLLVVITCGIYSFWLIPKLDTAQYIFYLDIKKSNGEIEEMEGFTTDISPENEREDEEF